MERMEKLSTSARPAENIRGGWQALRGRRTMTQMLRDTVTGRYRMSFFTIFLFIFMVAYIIYPHDLISDNKLLLGWVDDAFVVFLFVFRLNREKQRYNRFKAAARRNAA